MKTNAIANARASDEPAILTLARSWKAGELFPVHPSIGHRLNCALVAAGEHPVPFRRATNDQAPSLVDLIRNEYERAGPARLSGLPAVRHPQGASE